MFCCHFCLYLSKPPETWITDVLGFADLFFGCAYVPPDSLTCFIHSQMDYFTLTQSEAIQLPVVIDQCFLAVLVLKGTGLHKTSETLVADNVCWLSALPVLKGTKLTPWEADFFLFVTQSYILKTAWSQALVSFLCWVSCTGIGEVTCRTGSYLTGVRVLNNFC